MSDINDIESTTVQTATTADETVGVNRPFHFQKTPTPKKRDFGLFFKIGAIAALTIAFLVGLLFIDDLVRERQRYHSSVISKIKKMHTSDQTVITPFIIKPQTKYYSCNQYDSKQGKEVTRTCKKRVAKLITPSQSNWKHKVTVKDDEHRIGIYNAISYHNAVDLSAVFDINNSLAEAYATEYTNTNTNTEIESHPAKLILSISDLKGLSQLPSVKIAGKTYQFDFPKTQEYLGLNYVELTLPDDYFQTGTSKQLPMTFNLNFKGIDTLSTLPLGKNVHVTMDANWADPKFFGMTAQDKTITATNFNAKWFNTYNSIANTQALTACTSNNVLSRCDVLGNTENTFGMQFIDATSTYTLTDRTIKYALLLLMVVFGAFFLFEVTKDLRIHPIQYSLVGAALLVFYVLLLSLSEQIDFGMAYLSAAVACVSLMGWYVFYVLQSLQRAVLFTAILSALYASFYFIIQSEDNSLIMGSVFMFALLAAVMFFTRNIDWYEKA